MDQAEPNSQSIQQEQKQEMEQEPQQQAIMPEATSQPIEEEKQNEEQMENQEDLVDEQVENRVEANIEENANNLVQQQVQEEKQQVQEQRQAPLQEEVDNSIQAEVQEQMQNDEERQVQQQPIENQQEEVEVQAQPQQQQQIQIPPNQENQPIVALQNQPNISQEQQIENVPSRNEENILIRNEEEIQENIRKQRENDSQKAQQYIHKLERQLQSISTENNILKRDMATLRETQNKLRQDFQTNKHTVMDLRKKKLETQFQKTKAFKECDKLKKENESQRKKIEEIQKIGDIMVLKNALQELNTLAQAQKQEIEQLKSTTSQPLIEQLKQQLSLLQDYQNTKRKQEDQIQRLQGQNKMLLEQLCNVNNSLNSERSQVQKLKEKQSQLQAQIMQLNTTITNWQNKWHEFQNQRESNAKSRELQKKIFDYESQRNVGYQNEVIHLNILSDREEKDIILKEYLILEGKYKQQQFQFEETRSKLRKLERQQSRIYTSYIKKKQYNDLSLKYNKAKKCLEGAFQKLRLIRNDESQNQNVQDQVNELLEGTQARQCQQVIKKAHGIVSSLRDKVDGFQHNQNILSNKREYERMEQTIKLLINQQAQNQRILRLMTDDIKLKNKLIAQKNEIIETLRKRTLMMPNQAQNYKATLKLSNEVASLRETLSVFETQNILLIKEISSLNSQVSHWKNLYNNIKESLRQKITTSLQQKNTNGSSRIIGEQSISICKECEQRKLYLSSKEFESSQTQTDNLNQFYYKQIKDILAFLNKVAKECEKVPQLSKQLSHSINQIKEKFIVEFKDKYLRIQGHYNAKLNELKREKADNESWRVRAKEEIRQEFQDIRELIINNRLANALRQAKNLIDYLEVQVQKQDQQNPQEEMEQQNPVEEKKDERFM